MASSKYICESTPELDKLAQKCLNNDRIDASLYTRYEVKRGLRDLDGKGVLTGLTEISEIVSTDTAGGKTVPAKGRLFYRGINIEDLVRGFISEKRPGFEEATYLLLFGELPDSSQLSSFQKLLASYRSLPTNFVRDVILKAPNPDMMNKLARSILTLYSYDDYANDISIPNVLRQSLQLIAVMPLLAVYSYQAYAYYLDGQSLFIHPVRPELSTAENILHLLRPDSTFTKLEAMLLDLSLVLHAEHGGGNNSTFTTHVVSSSGTDTYSSVAASLCSLKGPKHGGANIKVVQMMTDIKENIGVSCTDGELRDYLHRILNKEAFDRTGLVYGMGHAVYSLSDPRAEIYKYFVSELSREKGLDEEFSLYTRVAETAAEVIAGERKIYKGVSPNIDFYSGFVYSMLGLPPELFTPIFAIARISGWSAHRIEELINAGKIIRPAYFNVQPRRDYVKLAERQ